MIYVALEITKIISNFLLQVIKDYQLFMVVGVLLCIDLIIMTTWQISDPFYRATKQMEAYVSILFQSIPTKFIFVTIHYCDTVVENVDINIIIVKINFNSNLHIFLLFSASSYK